MKKFTLTYSITTEESARHGDYAAHGFVTRTGTIPDRTYIPKNPATFTLKEAVEILLQRDSDGPVEADCCPVSIYSVPRWFTYGGGRNDDGRSIQVSLHLPNNITRASALRIARYLKCYGIR